MYAPVPALRSEFNPNDVMKPRCKPYISCTKDHVATVKCHPLGLKPAFPGTQKNMLAAEIDSKSMFAGGAVLRE